MNRLKWIAAGAAGLLFAGCGSNVCEQGSFLVTTSDYVEAIVGVADEDNAAGVRMSALAQADSVADYIGCTPVILERATGQLLIQSASDPLTTERTIDLNEAGASFLYATNPLDVLSVSDEKAYVIVGSRNEVIIIDPGASGSSAVLGTIDLSTFVDPGDGDGNVDAVSALLVGDHLYVGLARQYFDLNWQVHFTSSVIAVIDTIDDTLVDVDPTTAGVQGIATTGNNPSRGLWHDATSNTLWVASGGDFYAHDGGLEAIDLSTNSSSGIVLSEGDLGAEIIRFEAVGADRLLLLVDPDVATEGTSALLAYDATADVVDINPIAMNIDGMKLSNDTLFTFSRASGQGVRRYDPATGADLFQSDPDLVFGNLPMYSLAVPE